MAVWVTLHALVRPPVPRRLLVTLRTTEIGRELAALLAVAIVTVISAATPASSALAASAAAGRAAPAQDIAGPVLPVDSDAATTGSGTTGIYGPPTSGTRAAGVSAPPGDGQRQGAVVAVFQDPNDPLIVISVGASYLTVRLRCGALCPSIHLGDYVVAEGRRRSEAVFDAVEIWVVSP